MYIDPGLAALHIALLLTLNLTCSSCLSCLNTMDISLAVSSPFGVNFMPSSLPPARGGVDP
jgi:hypothetical protein